MVPAGARLCNPMRPVEKDGGLHEAPRWCEEAQRPIATRFMLLRSRRRRRSEGFS